jgi:lipopolysaccharide export system permease protein
VKILYFYLIRQVLAASLAASGVLTALLVLGNVYKSFDVLVNNDIPFSTIMQMIGLLVPPVLTFTVPWGLLVGVLLVFGRLSHDLELQAVRSAGIGLVPFIAPVILLSIAASFFCFYNNNVLSPLSMTKFKLMAIDLGRNNPTAFLRTMEPIDDFPGQRIFIEKKSGNNIEGIYIWQLDDKMIPKQSIRAEKGMITADLNNLELSITLDRVRVETRSSDTTKLDQIQSGIYAEQFPYRISLKKLLDSAGVKGNITLWTLDDLNAQIFSASPANLNVNFIPLLTEFQRRFAFSFASFTFVLVGIPLALVMQRKETSIGVVLSLGIVIIYYLMVILAMSFKERAAAYPELIVWAPNILFQIIGFYLIWKTNRHPA